MKNHPNVILFAGEIFDGRDEAHPLVKLKDGALVIVRVSEMPARVHLELLELFHAGREAELIQRCAERGEAGEAGAISWSSLFAMPKSANDADAATINEAGRAFVDSLRDESHELLAEACEKLNFDRAIKTAQRLIARGQKLGPLMGTIAKTMLEPMRKELGSWMSSLTTQLSEAVAAKTRSEKPYPG